MRKTHGKKCRSRSFLPQFSLQFERLESRALLTALSWSAGVSLPTSLTAAAAYETGIGTSVFGGFHGTQTPATVYNNVPGASNWTSAPALDRGRAGAGVGETGVAGPIVAGSENGYKYNSDIFVFGGINQTQASNSVANYDPSPGGESIAAPSMITARAFFGYATEPASGRLYAIGGLGTSNQRLALAERYDPVADSWSAIAPLPQALSNTTAAVDGAGHILVFGGKNASGSTVSTVYRYTIATNSWDAATPLPVAVSDASSLYAGYGLIYVIGGRSSAGAVASVRTYNPVLNSWAVETSLPTAVYDAASAIDYNGAIEVIGGTSAAGTAVTNVWSSPVGSAPLGLPAYPTIQLPDPYYTYNGAAQPTLATAIGSDGVTPVNGTFTYTYNGSTTPPTNVGTYPVIAYFTSADSGYVSAVANGVVTIFQASPTLPLTGGGTFLYDGNSHTVHATVQGVTGAAVSGTLSYTYNGTATAPVSPGTYAAVATFASTDPNYTGASATATVTIPDPTIPTGVSATGVSTTSLRLNWNPAYELNLAAATSYSVTEVTRHVLHSPKGSGATVWYTYAVIGSGITATNFTVTGLATANSISGSHTYLIKSFNASGVASSYSASVVAQPLYAPTYGYTLNGGAVVSSTTVEIGSTSLISAHFDGNQAPTYSLINAPATMSINPVSGLLTYSPAANEVGVVNISIRATNSVGSANASFAFNVVAHSTVVVLNGPLTVQSGTLDSGMTGAGSIVKMGSGIVTITGTNNYTLGTIIRAGTLIAGASHAIPDGGTLTVEAGATLIFSPATPTTASPVAAAASAPTVAAPVVASIPIATTEIVVATSTTNLSASAVATSVPQIVPATAPSAIAPSPVSVAADSPSLSSNATTARDAALAAYLSATSSSGFGATSSSTNRQTDVDLLARLIAQS